MAWTHPNLSDHVPIGQAAVVVAEILYAINEREKAMGFGDRYDDWTLWYKFSSVLGSIPTVTETDLTHWDVPGGGTTTFPSASDFDGWGIMDLHENLLSDARDAVERLCSRSNYLRLGTDGTSSFQWYKCAPWAPTMYTDENIGAGTEAASFDIGNVIELGGYSSSWYPVPYAGMPRSHFHVWNQIQKILDNLITIKYVGGSPYPQSGSSALYQIIGHVTVPTVTNDSDLIYRRYYAIVPQEFYTLSAAYSYSKSNMAEYYIPRTGATPGVRIQAQEGWELEEVGEDPTPTFWCFLDEEYSWTALTSLVSGTLISIADIEYTLSASWQTGISITDTDITLNGTTIGTITQDGVSTPWTYEGTVNLLSSEFITSSLPGTDYEICFKITLPSTCPISGSVGEYAVLATLGANFFGPTHLKTTLSGYLTYG